MSLQDWKMENDLCRCCHSEGTFNTLAEPYIGLERQEIYSGMLQQCFDLNITPIPGPLCISTYKICPDCILRLKDAFHFKEQVKKCEIKFMELYNKEALKLSSFIDIKIKEEVPDEEPAFITLKQENAFATEYGDDGESSFIGVKLKEEVPGEESSFIGVKLKEEVPKEAMYTVEVEVTPINEFSEVTRPKEIANWKAKSEAKAIQTQKVKEVENKEMHGAKTPAAPEFLLHEDDYTKDGDMYQCRKCDKKYYKISPLKFHLKTKHYRIPRFPCPYCPEVFRTPVPLTVHKLKEHDVDERLPCETCKATFNTKDQLRKHINNFHMMGELYKCEFCEYESFSIESIYKHKFKHKTVKDFYCRYCKKAFLRKSTLDLHERIHTNDRRQVCTLCSKAFVQKASLNHHMTKYHPEGSY